MAYCSNETHKSQPPSCYPYLQEVDKVGLQELLEPLVQFKPNKLGSAWGGGLLGRLGGLGSRPTGLV